MLSRLLTILEGLVAAGKVFVDEMATPRYTIGSSDTTKIVGLRQDIKPDYFMEGFMESTEAIFGAIETGMDVAKIIALMEDES